jgi:hypothetical protein
MQTIYPTSLTPEQYAEQEYHRQVQPPENCPRCWRAHALEALAYYCGVPRFFRELFPFGFRMNREGVAGC